MSYCEFFYAFSRGNERRRISMDESIQDLKNKNSVDELLFVVKYDSMGRMLWRLFFPYVLAYFLFKPMWMSSMNTFIDEDFSLADSAFLLLLTLILLSGVIGLLDQFGMKEIRVYKDRIEKEWYLFGTRRVDINNLKFKVKKSLLGYLISFVNINKRPWNNILMHVDMHLIDKNARNKLVKVFSGLSKQGKTLLDHS